ncbi:MAG: FAD-dependent oxidoreductase [Candidatus Hydrogenedentes bacterium]|nr:FAD-dependent oxidoreductase [Candidatus Hydrogenedentota bacterium]
MTNKRIVVIGGSAAGPKAAAKARRMDQNAEITIIQREAEFSMASCGYPYYVGGTFDNRNQLIETPTGVIRDSKFFMNAKGINAVGETEAIEIDRENKKVVCRKVNSGETFEQEYDKLVIATGASPFIPPVPGTDLKGITTLQSLKDADYLRKVRDEKKIKKAIVVGGGLIGIETCEALALAGIDITVIEMLPQIMMFLDWEMAKIIENYLKTRANIITGNEVVEFLGKDGVLTGVKLKNGTELACELAVVAVGVRPNSKIASDAGIKTGERGGITVNEYMQTSDPDIYAAGDCVEVKHLISGDRVLAPFGDLANLEGRVVGQNVINEGSAKFPGTVQTGVCKIFDYVAGATGFSERIALNSVGKDITSVTWAGQDKPGFMGAKPIIVKMVADNKTGRVLGVQCVGPGDASKRIAIAATAIQAGFTVDDILNLDLPYAPPFSPAIDPVITTAHILQNKMLGRMNGISCIELKKKLDDGEDLFLLDARGPDEFEEMRMGIGETLIPLGALRKRLSEIPKDKEVVCFCKISLRGYEAAGLLEANGWKNVKVLEGGIAAWPFGREK